MVGHIVIEPPLLGMSLEMPPEVDGDEFLIREARWLPIGAPALKFKRRMFIVHLADPQVEVNEFMFEHGLNVITACRSAFLPLIRIYYILIEGRCASSIVG